MELSIRECRELLNIQHRQTMNDHLKTLELFGRDRLSWCEFKKVLELQTFLGLRHGINSREQFKNLTVEEKTVLFQQYGVDINARLEALKQQQNTHTVSVSLVLNRD